MGRVEGKVVVVTGGAGGIGRATACALADEGVVVVDIDAEGAGRTVEAIESAGGSALPVHADLAEEEEEEEEVLAIVAATVDRFGRLDVRTAYGISKAGVNALTMCTAAKHGKQGVRVNTIIPGLIITDAVRAFLSESTLGKLGRSTLAPYLGQPEDVDHLVVFLASDQSRYITGQMITIVGGLSDHVGNAGGEDD